MRQLAYGAAAVVGLVLLAVLVTGAATSGPGADQSPVPRPANAQPMVMGEILSGDTVALTPTAPGPFVRTTGQVTARLIGLEASSFGPGNECYPARAQARLAELVPEGTLVWVTTDTVTRNDEGRWLLYLWGSDGRLVNYLMAVGGDVTVVPMPPNDRYDALLSDAQLQAFRSFGGARGDC